MRQPRTACEGRRWQRAAPGECEVRTPLPRDRAAGARRWPAPAGPAPGCAGGLLGARQARRGRAGERIVKTLMLFVATALAEIVGCYLPYLWLRKGGSAWLLLPAAVALAAFAWLLTL